MSGRTSLKQNHLQGLERRENGEDKRKKRHEGSRETSSLMTKEEAKKNESGDGGYRATGSTEKRTIISPRPVLGREYSTENGVSLRNAWVGTFRDKRDISLAMKMVGSILPGISHLKRCSGNRMILAFAAPNENSDEPTTTSDGRHRLESLLTDNGFDTSIFDNEFEIVPVPAVRQRTKEQASIASRYWPINFHPDPVIERILDGRFFDSRELETIERCMEACIEAALIGKPRGNLDCNGSAVIFNKIDNKIVAIAVSRTDLHPLWHAAMLAIHHVAILAGGAVDERIATPVNLVPIDNTAVIAPSSTNPSNDRYLCTDYWIFLLREPCPLCAMALVHSRVTNVFYGITNRHRGVLGSRALLHTTPGLNHRYRVWAGVSEQQCRRAFQLID